MAIHLDRAVSEKFSFNNETHLTPILASAVKAYLFFDDTRNNVGARKLLSAQPGDSTVSSSHHIVLMNLIADSLKIDASSIVDLDLCLFDTQPASIGGIYNEFIFSPRIDNLMMSLLNLTQEVLPIMEHQQFIVIHF